MVTVISQSEINEQKEVEYILHADSEQEALDKVSEIEESLRDRIKDGEVEIVAALSTFEKDLFKWVIRMVIAFHFGPILELINNHD